MRGIWWMLKLMAGLVLIGCLCAFALAVLFPELTRRAAAWAAVLLGSAALYWFANNRLGDTPGALQCPTGVASSSRLPPRWCARPGCVWSWQALAS